MTQDRTLETFQRLCVTHLSRKYAEALADQADFTAVGWMEVYLHCCNLVPRPDNPFAEISRCYAMKIVSLKKAIAVAKSAEDWISIYRSVQGRPRQLARKKLQELGIPL